MKKSENKIRPAFLLITTAIMFLLMGITIFLSNIIVIFCIKNKLISSPPEAPVILLLIQSGLISLFTGTFLTFLIGGIPLRPLNKIIQAIHDVAGGNFDTKLHLNHPKEFRKLSESFNQMTNELSGIEILRTDFINNFSHEFKTPIVSILGFAKLLKLENITEDEKTEYLNIIIEESQRLATLSETVLNLSRVESLSVLSDTQCFNLSEQIRQSILMLEQKWVKKNISFDLQLDEIQITGNKPLLKQVWMNLIDNAVKFSPSDSTVTITLEKIRDEAIFSVKDKGPGMNTRTQQYIFDKFYQGDSSRSSEGNGLGLPLVRKIVLLHNGSITVKSQPNAGSIFIIRLPILPD